MKNLYVIIGVLAIVHFYGNAQSQTWTLLNTGITDYIKEVEFVDENNGWGLYRDSLFLKTIDGGESWTTQHLGIDLKIWDIEFTDQNTGWAIGLYGGVFKTTNGGENWATTPTIPLSPTGFPSWLFSVHSFNTDTLLVGCDLGLIQKSTDGGATWNYVQNQGTGWVYDIQFVDNQIGYALDINNIYKTTNGGDSWTMVFSGSSLGMNNCYFYDENNGIIVGQQQEKVWYTNDGAQTLISCNIEIPVGILPVATYINNPTESWLSLNNQTLYKSIDMGANWTLEMENLSIADFSFVSPSVGYTSGLDGQIYKYSNPVSVNENIDGTSIPIIYPNPSNGYFTLDLGRKYKTVTVKINDLSGKILSSKNYSNVEELKLEFIKKSGLYFVNVEMESITKTIKLLIN